MPGQMQGGMCQMMGGGGGMMGMMVAQGDARTLQMRGEMMKAMGEVMMGRAAHRPTSQPNESSRCGVVQDQPHKVRRAHVPERDTSRHDHHRTICA